MADNNLIFFNKEGDSLNFKYDETLERYGGDILFHQNSSDTFKTFGLYTLENIPAFDYELPGELTLNKFQLFNEYGLHFYGSKYSNQQITKIEPVNNDPKFYSKWIYGDFFEAKFPIGCLIKFNQPTLEFTNLKMTYVVTASKKGAVLVVSNMDNKSFESLHFTQYSDLNYFLDKKISGINAFGVYNFVDNDLKNTLSDWSEPDFYDKYYLGQKLNFVNTELNNDIVGTVDNLEYYDPIHFEYITNSDINLITPNNKLIIEVLIRTDLPMVYDGSMNIRSVIDFGTSTYDSNTDGKLKIEHSISTNFKVGDFVNIYDVSDTTISTDIPGIETPQGITAEVIGIISPTTVVFDIDTTISLISETNSKSKLVYNTNVIELGDPSNFPIIFKPGTGFNIIGTSNNTIDFTISSIPSFKGNKKVTYYNILSQVIWNNKIYECVQSYTQNFSDPLTKDITPDNTSYWSRPTFIPVNESTVSESVLNGQIYLTSDRFYYDFEYIENVGTTLASTAEKYKDVLNLFNIDLFYENGKLQADLIYPSNYAEVNFYHTSVDPVNKISDTKSVNEKLVGIKEELNYELNYNISENFTKNIIFTDIDEFGIIVTINGEIYQEEVSYIFNGSSIDMERTIDRTLRNWITRHYIELKRLGILTDVQYVGNYTSVFYNSIVLTTEYPNVPVQIDEVEVGTTADYFIEHSTVLFPYTIGSTPQSFPYLEFTINNKQYYNDSISSSGNLTDVLSTLESWSNEHSKELLRLGIKVTNINNLLKFDVINADTQLEYSIKTGNLNLPGLLNYTRTNKYKGNHGSLITSNQIQLPDNSVDSFKEVGFATGMIVGINNTDFIWNNQEYNVQYINDYNINLSYEGPFWGLTDSGCNNSPFTTLAFTTGFTQSNCIPDVSLIGTGGPFDKLMFDDLQFSINWNPSTYIFNIYNTNSFTGTDNLVDIIYVQLSDYLYSFGDAVVVQDAWTGTVIKTIDIPSNTDSIKIIFNTVNNYLYCLSKNRLSVINPLTNTLENTVSLTNDAFDIDINPINGDVYISYENVGTIDIFYESNTINTSSANKLIFTGETRCGNMVFNDFEQDMYVTTSGNKVIKIDGNLRTIQTSIIITDLKYDIYYEPVNESIYVYSTSGLWRISGGIPQSISIPYNAFNDILFNNLTGNLEISDSSSDYNRLSLSDNTTQVNNIANYGYMALNQFDGHIYLSSLLTDSILVINPTTGTVVYTETLGAGSTKLVYNPRRKSIFSIVPSSNEIVELKVELNNTISSEKIKSEKVGDNLYGTLSDGYEQKDELWLKTRDYVRKPRESFSGDIPTQYYWKWFSDNVSEFFMYDFSGDQLTETGDYVYSGPKPLTDIILNKKPNTDLTKLSEPSYQQTIFDKVENTLSYIDDEDDISTEPEALQLFLGFKSEKEGSLRSVLQLYKKEDVSIDIESNEFTDITFELIDDVLEPYGLIKLNTNSPETFTKKGLKPGQLISFKFTDITNKENQYISPNNGVVYKIINVFSKYITVMDSINFSDESTKINDYPNVDDVTYLKTNIKVIDKEIGRFTTYGQTEIEDLRYKTELGNEGKLIGPDETFIFKDYDIKEGGIDWNFLNIKRKELLTTKHLIYPYIGSYKSIINAINFFGYNDLQLNEYYENINSESENFHKLFKVEIPDVFDNTVDGFNENDFIKGSFPNKNYEETNLFNLTYFITDKEGNNLLNYSLDEVIVKLQGLKYWLKRNIIPLTHNIKDILGVASFKQTNGVRHKLNKVNIKNIRENMTPIVGKLDEAYLMPVNSGSTVYNCVVSMFSIIPGVGTDKTLGGLITPPKPFNGVELVLPDTYTIEIKTYKTYKEWLPFTIYSKGDKVSYYTRIYEATDNSKMENPRNYENVDEWSMNVSYTKTEIVVYNRQAFVYKGIDNQITDIIPPNDNNNWQIISKWKEIDYEPVQNMKELRSSENLDPFNFTVDSNIDPFITVNIVSDNGYGVTYGDRKNYELRGLKDLTEEIRNLDNIGPFKPIIPIV